MWERELQAMKEAALEAEKEILRIYATPFETEIKEDNSPVTAADKGADKIIREYLLSRFPEAGMLTEESQDTKERLSKDLIFVVDPVDGTKEFVARNGEFTTNIALVHKHEVVAGVINVPMQNKMAYATRGGGAYIEEKGKNPRKISVNDQIGPRYDVLMSRSFATPAEKDLISRHQNDISSVSILGAATKFIAIADGEAHLFFRFSSGTKEWDVAAGDILVTEAGGYMVKPDGTRYTYNREDVYNREGYILLNRMENFLK